jgi:hypothetical protein
MSTSKLAEITDSSLPHETLRLYEGNEHAIDYAFLRLRSAAKIDARIRGFIFSFQDESGVAEAIVRVEPSCNLNWRLGYLPLPSLLRSQAVVMHGALLVEGEPDIEKVLDMLRDSCVEQAGVDVVSIPQLSSSRVGDSGSSLAANGFEVLRRYEVSGMTILATKDESIARLKKKRRYNIKRQLRMIMEEHGGVIRVYRSRAEVESFLDLIRPVQEGTYQNRIASTVTNSPLRREAVLESSDLNGHLCLTLEIDGDIAAFQIGRFFGTNFSLEELGFDRRFEKLAPGMSLLYASMDELAKDKIEYMHFGEGSAQYKTVLSDQSEVCYSYIGYSNRLRCHLDRRIARGTKIFDNLIWKAIPANRIKRMVRRFLSSSRSANAC